MLRQSSANMNINNKELLDQPLFDPLNSIKKERNCNRRWIVCVWGLSNVFTFMLGYFLKSRFDDEDKSLDGSLSLK